MGLILGGGGQLEEEFDKSKKWRPRYKYHCMYTCRKNDNNMKVWISAGHQANTGANGFISEGVEAIYLRDKITAYIKEKAPYIEVVNDSDGDGLQTTINNMRKVNPDIMLDLHFNAATPSATGAETFISSEKSKVLANELVEVVSNTLGIKKRGVKAENASQHNRLGMLHGFDGIGVLLEVCFVTNEADAKSYTTHREELAEAIGDILIYKVQEDG